MSQPQQLHVSVRFEDDAFWATVDEFPGVFATGDTLDELRKSLEEGIALVLARADGETPAVTVAPLKHEPVAVASSAQLTYSGAPN